MATKKEVETTNPTKTGNKGTYTVAHVRTLQQQWERHENSLCEEIADLTRDCKSTDALCREAVYYRKRADKRVAVLRNIIKAQQALVDVQNQMLDTVGMYDENG